MVIDMVMIIIPDIVLTIKVLLWSVSVFGKKMSYETPSIEWYLYKELLFAHENPYFYYYCIRNIIDKFLKVGRHKRVRLSLKLDLV